MSEVSNKQTFQAGEVVNGWTFVKEYRSFNLWQRKAGGSILRETFPKGQLPKEVKKESSGLDLSAFL